MAKQRQTLEIIQPDDWHLHVRDGSMLKAVIGYTAQQFGRAIIMPNLVPPVTTTKQALAYKENILLALKEVAVHCRTQANDQSSSLNFTPLMTLYLTDNTPRSEIRKAKDSGAVYAVKLYPAGATTNSDAGVTDLLGQCAPTLEKMQALGMPLLVHGEVVDPKVDVFDREAVFIDRVMIPLRKSFPELKVVFEHLTTKEGVDYVLESEGPIAATITPQHLLYNRNDIFNQGLRPHWYCLPVLKREKHRQALLTVATSGHPRFFLGTDSAPHTRLSKEQDYGCAGCFTAMHALPLYLQAFEEQGGLDNFESFASLNGPAFYGLEPNSRKITLVRQPQEIAHTLPVPGTNEQLVPLAAGTKLNWQVLMA